MIGASIENVSNITIDERKEKPTVQVLAIDRPLIGREQDSDNPAIPEYTNELEWLAPAAETPLGLRESCRGT